ncbi:lytic transglycosylase domain-containing protein [Sphingomonas sp.]|uniref:lytic murein transglycosylase n=1 Tax=Sphingomonas sp. TaxID=28214 RepID=UPI001D384150|nr:lytic murein transglycosylase [Sphingomonas sp.]MBX9796398.1 lytic murein transglycosylase [Sphingomonas sp.]
MRLLFRRPRIALAALLAALAAIGPAAAQDAAGFQNFLVTLRQQALARGVTPATVDQVFPTLMLDTQVIALDRRQPAGPANTPPPMFEPYRRSHVDAQRIAQGRQVYQSMRSRLATIEAQTGVPESMMVAIWGHETNYGAITGNFDLPNALATLAYEGRRRDLFTDEFIASLKMLDRGVPRARLRGSWAGATGNPQFLPSVYLRLARDGDGDGTIDIWTSEADTLASIANYFVSAGWRRGQGWGFAVSVPSSLDRAAIANRTVAPRCPRVFERHSMWKTMREWRALGLAPVSKPWPDDTVMATLLEPDGIGKPGYLLTGNYRVILDYNCSNFYALSVGLLADAVEQ